MSRMPGVWPAVLQKSTKYAPTTVAHAAPASTRTRVVSSCTSAASEATSARIAPPVKTIAWAIAASIARATARVARPA